MTPEVASWFLTIFSLILLGAGAFSLHKYLVTKTPWSLIGAVWSFALGLTLLMSLTPMIWGAALT